MAAFMPLDDGKQIPGAGDAPRDAGSAVAGPAGPPAVGNVAMASDLGDAPITLAFDDLLPDSNGEIVVTGSGFGAQLSIVTDQRICAEGVADNHVTVDGFEVAGLAYFSFEGGTTLYYSPDIELTIAAAHG